MIDPRTDAAQAAVVTAEAGAAGFANEALHSRRFELPAFLRPFATRAQGEPGLVREPRFSLTRDEYFVRLVNSGLQEVYKTANFNTMSEQKSSKLNQLLRQLGDADLASARWLSAHGYSSSLLARYVSSGWLTAPARGVYTIPRASLHWAGVVQSLQQREALRLHVGGRFALAWRGHEHYLRLGEPGAVTLYGPDRLPGWLAKLPIPERFLHCGRGPFTPTPLRFTSEADDERLFANGLELEVDATTGGAGVVMASNERAMLELCDERPGTAQILEADAVMQGLSGLRPGLVVQLLCQCHSVKAKRLFLALAERHNHSWLARVPLQDVDLGSGKRVLAPGGRLHPKYLITLPEALDEHLG